MYATGLPQIQQNQARAEPWKQLQRVGIPIFSGDKRTFESFREAFMACVDSAPATPQYKLLQLRQYLAGEALTAIERFGYSPSAYDAAKKLLERKYGGERRRVALHIERAQPLDHIDGSATSGTSTCTANTPNSSSSNSSTAGWSSLC